MSFRSSSSSMAREKSPFTEKDESERLSSFDGSCDATIESHVEPYMYYSKYGSIDSTIVENHLDGIECKRGDTHIAIKDTTVLPMSRKLLQGLLVIGLAVIFVIGSVHVSQRIEVRTERQKDVIAPPSMNLIGNALSSVEDIVVERSEDASTSINNEMTELESPLFVSEMEIPLTGAENDLVRCSCPFPGAPSPFNNYVCYPPAYNAMCAPNEICKEVNIIQVGQPSAIHLGYFMCTDHVCTEGATCSCASPGGAPGNNLPQSNCFVCKNPDGTACINYILTSIEQCCSENHICSSVANVNHAIATSNTNVGGLCQVHR